MDDEQKQPEMIEKEKYLRLAADFENYKKRMQGELAEMSQFGARLVIGDVLDALDYLHKALDHAPPNIPPEWLDGLKAVEHQFESVLTKSGVTRIRTNNAPFDPATMEAVTMADGGESQTVKQEARAGYTMHGRVIRPARVIIYQ